MIAARCPTCAAPIRAPDSAAGKRGKCPKCGERMQIPAREEVEPALTPAVRPERHHWVAFASISLLLLVMVVIGAVWAVGRVPRPTTPPIAQTVQPAPEKPTPAIIEPDPWAAINKDREREAAERKRTEAIQKQRQAEADRRKKALQREFDLLPAYVQFDIQQVREKTTIKSVADHELTAVLPYWQHTQFTRDQIIEALAVIGDRYGAAEQIKILGVTDPVKRARLRAAFGILGPRGYSGYANWVARTWVANPSELGDEEKEFIKTNRTAFPERDR
jgi:hypothetical protein